MFMRALWEPGTEEVTWSYGILLGPLELAVTAEEPGFTGARWEVGATGAVWAVRVAWGHWRQQELMDTKGLGLQEPLGIW